MGCDEPVIHFGRPGGVPAAIFSPALATLQWRLDHLEKVKVSRPDVERAAKYLQCAVAFYEDEKFREKAIKDIVDDAIGEKGNWDVALTWANGIRSVGAWWYISIIKFLFLVLEIKNSLGLTGDAILQAALDYAKVVSQEKVRYSPTCRFGCRGLPLFTVQECPGVL